MQIISNFDYLCMMCVFEANLTTWLDEYLISKLVHKHGAIKLDPDTDLEKNQQDKPDPDLHQKSKG